MDRLTDQHLEGIDLMKEISNPPRWESFGPQMLTLFI